TTPLPGANPRQRFLADQGAQARARENEVVVTAPRAPLSRRAAVAVQDAWREQGGLMAPARIAAQGFNAAKGFVKSAVVDPAVNAPRDFMEGGRLLRENGYEAARPRLAASTGNAVLTAGNIATLGELGALRGVAGAARAGAREAVEAAPQATAQAAQGAEAGALDMSTEARMARADKAFPATGYHGTTNDVRAFDPDRAGAGDAMHARATWMGETPNEAYFGSNKAWQGSPPPGANVMPLRYNPGKQFVVDAQGAMFDAVPVDGIKGFPYRGTARASEIVGWAQKKGYNSVRFKNMGDAGSAYEPAGDVVAVLDPKRIRSRNAAFDPRNANSPDLLADAMRAPVEARPTNSDAARRAGPIGRPARRDTPSLPLAVGGGLLGASLTNGDARAQEAAAGERDDGLAIAQERVATLDRQIGLLSGFDASDPIAVAQVQRQIGARVDGQLGPETRAAIAQRLTQLQQERAFAQSQAQKAMQTAEDQRQAEMVERLSPKPEDLAKQEMLLAAAGLGGLIFAKTGLPIPRSLPGVGRFSGAGGRAGNVYATEQRLARDMVRADAMKFSSKMPQSDADLAKRVANVNQYWSYGGASPGRVPFRVGRGPAPTIRRNATEAPALFRPPRYNAGDATAMSAAGLDVGFSTVRLEEAKAKLKEAEADYNADTGSEAKLRRVMDLRKEVMAWQTAQAAGAGYLGGRVTAGLERPGNKLPRPNYAAAQTEQGRLANYISLNAPPPQSGGRRLLTSPPPQTPSASPVPAKARSRTRAPAVGSDAHIQGVADRARAAGFDIQKARTTSGTYDAMILRAQTDPKFRDWLAQNWQVIQ
ncbi:MAG: hypothetical protein EBR82_53325, partial [Caulobacteraceae bacterium]|nr:hypothetical protein [Caulobacteraceae bacterium]